MLYYDCTYHIAAVVTRYTSRVLSEEDWADFFLCSVYVWDVHWTVECAVGVIVWDELLYSPTRLLLTPGRDTRWIRQRIDMLIFKHLTLR